MCVYGLCRPEHRQVASGWSQMVEALSQKVEVAVVTEGRGSGSNFMCFRNLMCFRNFMCFPCVRVCVQSTHSAEAQRECGAGVRQRLAYTDGDAIDRRCSHTHPHPHFEPEPADGGTSVVSARLSECARAWEWVGGSKRAWTRVEPPAQNPWGVFAGRAVWASAFRSPCVCVCVCVCTVIHTRGVRARAHACTPIYLHGRGYRRHREVRGESVRALRDSCARALF